jgi:hypothetical protein
MRPALPQCVALVMVPVLAETPRRGRRRCPGPSPLFRRQLQHDRSRGRIAHHPDQPWRMESSDVQLGRGDSDAPLHLKTGDQGGNYLLTRAP